MSEPPAPDLQTRGAPTLVRWHVTRASTSPHPLGSTVMYEAEAVDLVLRALRQDVERQQQEIEALKQELLTRVGPVGCGSRHDLPQSDIEAK